MENEEIEGQASALEEEMVNTEEISENPAPEEAPAAVSAEDNHILRVSSLYKQFGHKKVVRGVEFSMQMGEVLLLYGSRLL